MANWQIAISLSLLLYTVSQAEPWQRHVIDNSSRGADGVRLADANGDGLLDFTTAWEEGGKIRVYLNPGPKLVKQKWPAVTVGDVKSPEDAVLVDLDQDGAMDVVSSCEGSTRTLYVHWAPKNKEDYRSSEKWKTVAIPASIKQQSWMFAMPLQIDGKHGLDLVTGSKNKTPRSAGGNSLKMREMLVSGNFTLFTRLVGLCHFALRISISMEI